MVGIDFVKNLPHEEDYENLIQLSLDYQKVIILNFIEFFLII